MKDIVTYETAVRLKEAGFLQPTPGPGQFWYNPDFGLFFVGNRSFTDARYRYIFYPDTGAPRSKNVASFSVCYFAPTATDIISYGGMTMAKLTWINASDGMDWECAYEENEYFDRNPAEAAASAWLALNEKK